MTPTGLATPPTDQERHEHALAELGVGPRAVIPPHSPRGLPNRFIGPPLWISVGAHALALLGLLLYVQLGPERTPVRSRGMQTVQVVDLVTPEEIENEPGAPAAPAPASEGPTTPGEAAAQTQPGVTAPPLVTSQGGEQVMPAPPAGGAEGAGSVAERLRPGFSDPRLYADQDITRMREPGISDTERYRRHFQARIDALNDSMYGGSRPDTDWTVADGSGNRWGISEEGVHLGPLTIPRALVPFPAASGTNQDLEEAREQRRQREEIDRQEADRERRRALEESRAAARERRQDGQQDDEP